MKLSRDNIDRLELGAGLLAGVIITAILVYRLGVIFIALLVAAGLLAITIDRLRNYYSARFDDERLEKIGLSASMNAMLTTMIMALGLELSMVFGFVPEIGNRVLLPSLMFLMFAVFMGTFIFYYWKGDVMYRGDRHG